jgi:hypothetical protein
VARSLQHLHQVELQVVVGDNHSCSLFGNVYFQDNYSTSSQAQLCKKKTNGKQPGKDRG